MSANDPQPLVRPLPPRPSLEFERKEAKALLRQLHAGDPDAIVRARARHPAIDASQRRHIRLADAQLVIAREYGFASWPRLVRWFEDVERQRHGRKKLEPGEGRDSLDAWVRTLLAEHCDRRTWTARLLAAYVPRFFGRPLTEVFASAVTEDEARLAVARERGFPSWEVLVEQAEREASRERSTATEVDPMRLAGMATEAGDLEALQRVVAAHPELLHPPEQLASRGYRLLANVVRHERRQGVEALRPIREWLASQGLDYQLELNQQLCGHMHISTETVRWLLDRGAEPDWVAPNGVPVLEHALIRYWNGEAVDLVAARTRPRAALWIAAGLGDVAGLRHFLDARGQPTAEARRVRPEFGLVGPASLASPPEPDGEEILIEAFALAMLNGRTRVLEELVRRGFPIDTLRWGSPLVLMAVGNRSIPVLETLVRLGANLDLRGWRPAQSAREAAREMFEQNPEDEIARRVAELCGLDPVAVRVARDARPAPTPERHPLLEKAFAFAQHDASRLGQPEVRPENLLYGVLRATDVNVLPLRGAQRADLDRYAAEVGPRVRAIGEHVERATIPMHADAQTVIDRMLSIAAERRRDFLTVYNLLHALAGADDGPVATLLARYGSSASTVRAALESAL